MNLLPFGKLPAAKPRTFVPQTIDLGDWPQIAPLFDQLEARAAQAKSAAELGTIGCSTGANSTPRWTRNPRAATSP